MHKLLADKMVASIRTRVAQGDNPTEPAVSVENLEDLVLTLAALSQNPGTSNTSGEALRAHLRDHWLANIVCDHEAKTDTAICSCSQWADTPHPSVGAAVDAWIEHVFTTLPAALEPRASDREAVLIDLETLKWWRELVDLNPADLAPRLDDRIAAAIRKLSEVSHEH